MSLHVHASALVLGEAGVLVRGPSGSGKSALVLALMALAPQFNLFARLVGDDRIGLTAQAGRLVMRPHPALAGQVENRGRGIVTMPFLPAAVAGLVVEIGGAVERLPEDMQAEVLGIALPLLRLRAGMASLDAALAVLACDAFR